MAKKKTSTKPTSTASVPKGGREIESPTSDATYPTYRADMGEGLPPQEPPKTEK